MLSETVYLIPSLRSVPGPDGYVEGAEEVSLCSSDIGTYVVYEEAFHRIKACKTQLGVQRIPPQQIRCD